MFYIWQRSQAKQEELFWRDTTWTSVLEFGQLYTFHEAIKIIEKRFHNKNPMPLIQRESYFIKREKKKRMVKGKFNTSKTKGKENV